MFEHGTAPVLWIPMSSASPITAPEDVIEQLHILHASGQSDEVRQRLTEITQTEDRQSVPVTRLYGNLLFQWGLHCDAITLLQDAHRADPANPFIANDLGVIQFTRRELQAAEQNFLYALSIDPRLPCAEENLQCVQSHLNAARQSLSRAHQSRLAWRLNEALALVNQTLEMAIDLDEAERLKRTLRVELGHYGATRGQSDMHDARPFSLVIEAICAGELNSRTSLGQRRMMHSYVFKVDETLDPNLPQSLKDLRLGLLTSLDENYPASITLLSTWLDCDASGWSLNMIESGDDYYALEVSCGPVCVQTRREREALLPEIALRISDPRIVSVVTSVLVRALRTSRGARDARRVEQFIATDGPDVKRLLDHLRYCDVPRREACNTTPKRQNLILIGTCIAEGMRFFLNQSHAFRARYRLRHFITNRAAPSMAEFVIDDEVLHDSAIVVHVAPQWADWGNEQAYIDLLARIPAQVQRISFPYPVFQPLWPFHCKDPRGGADLPEIFYRPLEERPHYPYGDSRVLGMMRELEDADAVVRRYLTMDLRDEIDLDRLLAKTLEIRAEKESVTDIKIVDFIAQNFRHRKLFDSINHITNAGALYISNQVSILFG